ncbi:acetate/propionate family kinase [Pseudochelatococcus contaminans]|uniref:Acetate kinase n=1 Tax=Pseudochelatococcus contaminans TaxID=1538103 RepID=A0A7W6EFU7_9HYPH|nr:acetate/propionate family kinase [Pseudochelatococcus contaminans]MBB3809043.1 acetate kinase [Pseudochelatococcus contaminans]
MSKTLIVLNAGSSSIKFVVFDVTEGKPVNLATGQIEGLGASATVFSAKDGEGQSFGERNFDKASGGISNHAEGVDVILRWIDETFPGSEVVAVGHRVVHGGVRFTKPVKIDDTVIAELEKLIPLAPIHQPHNIAGILAAREAFPGVPQVAVFDTSFHRGHPFYNDTFAIPREFYNEGVRRYGFHGVSYEYVTRRMKQIAPLDAEGRVVIAHLGNGASMCAVRYGHSIASTMGFSALDGLPMGTRCGNLDAGVLLYMLDQKGYSSSEIRNILYTKSGLLGLSGLSQDMRDLEASDTREAREAIDYFVNRVRREVGALSAALDGLDAMVFCGGIGENSWRVRERVLQGMQWIGIDLDEEANHRNARLISSPLSRVRVYIVRTNEGLMIAEHTLDVLGLLVKDVQQAAE